MASQALITRAEFHTLGVAETRVPAAYREEENPAMDLWIQAGSAKVLGSLQSFITPPLVTWGEDLKEWAAVFAAWTAKGVIGLSAGEAEYEQLKDRYLDAQVALDRIARRKRLPDGTTDSTPESTDDEDTNVSRPKIVGYKRLAFKAF